MAKYVRTSDNKIRDLDNITIGGENGWKDKDDYIKWLEENENINIIKQADTIEELIERYIVVLEHQDKPIIVYKYEIDFFKHCFVNKIESNNRVLAIYGSIWVGADLISKAKMNDKGELELL